MKMVMIGCSHHDSAVEFRERIAFSTDQAMQALDRFREKFPQTEAVLLSTCNRVELYAAATSDKSELERSELVEFLARSRGLPAAELMEGLIYRSGAEVVEHLLTVAASLDSLVVGESQILGQVKEAYELACKTGSAGPLTHTIFQAASHVAKRVAHETDIHQRRVSVPSVAIGEVATELFERLDDKVVLVIGAGEMADEALRYLRQQGARDVRLVNRSYPRAEALATTYGHLALQWDQLDRQILEADLVVSTTSAAHPIMTLGRFTPLHVARGGRMLLVLDLAVPRDFEHEIGQLAGVYLYAVDDLKPRVIATEACAKRNGPKPANYR